jgi:hypothetical protein
VGREYAHPFLKDAVWRRFPGVKIIPTTETDKRYNTFAQIKNSSGYDEVSKM